MAISFWRRKKRAKRNRLNDAVNVASSRRFLLPVRTKKKVSSEWSFNVIDIFSDTTEEENLWIWNSIYAKFVNLEIDDRTSSGGQWRARFSSGSSFKLRTWRAAKNCKNARSESKISLIRGSFVRLGKQEPRVEISPSSLLLTTSIALGSESDVWMGKGKTSFSHEKTFAALSVSLTRLLFRLFSYFLRVNLEVDELNRSPCIAALGRFVYYSSPSLLFE